MKDDKYTKSLAKNKVCVIIHQLRPHGFSLKKWVGKSPEDEVNNSYARYSETRFTQIYKVFLWRRHVGVPLRGTNMAARNQQKHQFLMREFIRVSSCPG